MVIQDVEAPMEISRKNKKKAKHSKTGLQTVETNPYKKECENVVLETKGDSSGSCVDSPIKSKRRKTRQSIHEKDLFETSSSASNEEVISESKQSISKADLKELREVYKKCKAIVKKIETKYGHLLENIEGSTEKLSDLCNEKCQCQMNKKIVFDDSGNEIVTAASNSAHICSEKLPESIKPNALPAFVPQVQQQTEQDITLPDNIKELSEMLFDTNLDIAYRNSVIKKLNYLRAENSYEIRMNKNLLVNMVEESFEDVIDFQGTNLDTLPGYIM